MREPVRWRDPKGGADADTRALLSSVEAPAPSSNERERVWSGVASALQAVPVLVPPVAPIAAAGSGALAGKIVMSLVAVAAAGVGWHVTRTWEPSAKPRPLLQPPVTRPAENRTPMAVPTEGPAIVPAAPAAEKPTWRKSRAAATAPSVGKVVEVPTPAPVATSAQLVTNELLEEGRRLASARAALRAHEPEHALELLQKGTAGTHALAQEREALTIEALASRPASRAQAAARARTFMATYPDSPYRARIKAVVFENP